MAIVTGYGLDGSEFEPWSGQDFSYPSRLALGSTQPLARWVSGLLSGGKGAGTWR